MNESSEIKTQINNILKNMQLPREIKAVINNIYKEYEIAYEKLLLSIKQSNIIERKEIQALENHIKSDYEEDVRISEVVEYEEYEQKRTKIVELIGSVLKGINDKEKYKIVQTVEKPTDKENSKAANIMLNIAISEIESSGRNVGRKVIKQKPDNQELKQIVVEFEEEVKRIIEDAKQKTPQISEILNNHYDEICEQLSGAIEKYNEKVETKKEERDMAHRREEFTKIISNYEQVKSVEISNIKQEEEVEELEH